jgi:hypothetical protein
MHGDQPAAPDVAAELADLQDTLANDPSLSAFEQSVIQQDIAACEAEAASAPPAPSK